MISLDCNLRMFALIATALLVFGCASPNTHQIKVQHWEAGDVKLYGVLIYDGENYKLSSKMLTERDALTNWHVAGRKKQWLFDPMNLEPIGTSRYSCEITDTFNECKQYESRTSEFIHVDSSENDYGLTLRQQSLKKGEGLNAGKVIMGTMLYAVASPVFVIFSPFIVASALSENGDYFVEFHHDDFHNKIISSLSSAGYASHESYVASIRARSRQIKELDMSGISLWEQQEQKNNLMIGELKNISADIVEVKEYPSEKYGLIRSALYPDITTKIESDSNIARTKGAIREYFAEKEKQMVSHYRSEKKRVIETVLKKQKNAYSYAKSPNELVRFINRFESSDPAQLVDKARTKLTQIYKKQAAVIRAKKAAKAERLEKWRSGLLIGADTFCGPIVRINKTMVKISLANPLRGYANESWVKLQDLYPTSYDCVNRNGVLSTN